MFVTFEGIDGSGKTTQVELLREHLEGLGRAVVVEREPGGTPTGERVRELLLEGFEMTAWTEAYLFAAARAELVETVIKPALRRGADVILDRHVDSSLAYQGVGRGLGLDEVLALNRKALQDVEPHRTFLLALPAEDVSGRLGRQLPLFASAGRGGPPDRMEREDVEFMRAVEEGYRLLAGAFPDRIVELDAREPPKRLATKIRSAVKPLLGRTPAAHAAADCVGALAA